MQPFQFQPTVNTGNLPTVGVQAAVAGAQQFFSDMGRIETWMGRVGGASTRMAGVAGSAFRVVGQAMTSSAAVMFAATASIEAAGGAAIGLASTFQQKMTIAQAALGETSGAMRELSDSAIEMARVAPISVSQLADATVELSKAGINIKQMSEGALEAASNLMIASGGELTIRDAALLIAGGMNAFNIAGTDAAEVADALTAAANSSAITFRDLRLSFQQTAAPAAALGYSIGETTTALGLLGRAGLRGSDAGTSLKQMFISLLAPSAKAKDAINQYGLTLYDSNGNALAMRAVVDELQKAFGDEAVAAGKVTEAERTHALALIFGSDAWRAATILAREGVQAYDDMAAAAKNLTAAQMAQKMLGAVNTQFQILRNNVEAAAVIIGREALPALGALLESFNKVAQSIKPEVFELLGRGLVASLTGGDISGIMKDARAQLGAVAPVFDAWLQLLLDVRSAIINQVVPGFYTLFTALGEGRSIGDVLVSTFNSIGRAVKTVATAVSGGLTAIANVLNGLRSSATGLIVVETVFKGLSALPLVALAAVVAKIASSFLGLGSSTFVVALAIGALSTILPKTQEDWLKLGNTLSQYVYPALIAVGAVMTYIAAVQLISMGAAIGQVATRFIAFGSILAEAVVFPIANVGIAIATGLIPAVGRAVIAFATMIPGIVIAGLQLGVLAVQATASATALTALFVVRTVASAFTFFAGVLPLGMYALQAFFAVIAGVSGAFSLLQAGINALRVSSLVGALGNLASGAIAAGGALLTSLGGAIAAVATAITPFLVGLLAIGAVIGAVYIAWTNDWFGIQEFTGRVINFVIDRLNELFTWLKSIPEVGKAFDWIEGVAKTAQTELPKVVDAGKTMVDGLIWQFQHGFPIIQDLMKGMLTPPEMELSGALTRPTKFTGWDQYNLGARQAKAAVDEWTAANEEAAASSERAASASASAMKAAQRRVSDLRDEVNNLEAALRDAYNEMEKWSDPKLVGMTAADDAIFALEQAHKQVQIEILKTGEATKKSNKDVGETFDLLAAQQRELSEGIPVALQRYQWAQKQAAEAAKRSTTPSKEQPKTANEILADELDKELQIAKLQRDITFDPQLRAAKKLYDQLKGTDKEVTLQQALDNIRAADKTAKDLEDKLKPAKEKLTAAEQAVKDLQDQQEAAAGYQKQREQTLKTEGDILDRLQRMTIQLNAQKDAMGWALGGASAQGVKSPWERIPSSRYNDVKAAAVELQGSLMSSGESTVSLEDALAAVEKSYKDIGRYSVDYERAVLTNWKNLERSHNEIAATGREYDRIGSGPLKTIEDGITNIASDTKDVKVWWGDVDASVSGVNEKLVTYRRQMEINQTFADANSKAWLVIQGAVDAINKGVGPDTPFGKALAALLGISNSSPSEGRGPNLKPPNAFASGTMFAPGGMALVGEGGPEVVYLPRGSQVYPTRATNYSSQSYSTQNTYNISGAQSPLDILGYIARRERMNRITGGR